MKAKVICKECGTELKVTYGVKGKVLVEPCLVCLKKAEDTAYKEAGGYVN